MTTESNTIEGRNPVLEALKARRPINRVLVSRTAGRHTVIAQILDMARKRNVPIEFVDEQAMRRVSETPAHQGVIALIAAREYASFDDLFAAPKARKEAALYCVLDGIEDPQNLGAILRTADATGFHGIVVRSRRAVGLTPVVAKVSAGAIEYVPVARVANIAQTLETLKTAGVWAIGVDMRGQQEYTKVDFKMPVALVIGGEGQGISELVRKRCDILARIPMKGHIGSLNASVAAALVMYEAFRQRNQT